MQSYQAAFALFVVMELMDTAAAVSALKAGRVLQPAAASV
jgi:hypothetical protein